MFAVPAAPAGVRRAGLGPDGLGTGAQGRGREGAEGVDVDYAHRVEQVDSAETVPFARRLAKEEGLLVGISCGAAGAVAAQLARQAKLGGKTIMVVLPDASERNLSNVLFEGIGV